MKRTIASLVCLFIAACTTLPDGTQTIDAGKVTTVTVAGVKIIEGTVDIIKAVTPPPGTQKNNDP